MYYSVEIFRTLSRAGRNSSNPEKTALRKWSEEPGYVEILQQRVGNLVIKRLLLIKGNQISQVKECSAFLCMGKCKSPDSLKSFLSYASQLSGPVSFVFQSGASFPQGSLWAVAVSRMAARSQVFVLCSFGAHRVRLEGCNCWWHPCLLTWQKIFHFCFLLLVRNLTNVWRHVIFVPWHWEAHPWSGNNFHW